MRRLTLYYALSGQQTSCLLRNKAARGAFRGIKKKIMEGRSERGEGGGTETDVKNSGTWKGKRVDGWILSIVF